MKALEYKLAMGTVPSKLKDMMTSLESLSIPAEIKQGYSPIDFVLVLVITDDNYANADYMFSIGTLVGGSIARSWM
ncbi:MAG: hypothetical protein KAH32_08995 [Chlamydiia bacterium]|nr:hypothetical protein [Chlamydiia bacterium]